MACHFTIYSRTEISLNLTRFPPEDREGSFFTRRKKYKLKRCVFKQGYLHTKTQEMHIYLHLTISFNTVFMHFNTVSSSISRLLFCSCDVICPYVIFQTCLEGHICTNTFIWCAVGCYYI